MTHVRNPNHCYVCNKPFQEDYESLKVPTGVRSYPLMTSGSGIVEFRFCCKRHKRDWKDERYKTPTGGDNE